ncbi:MAG: DUF2384 domain-containing protein [Gammaproteobacteria bacterium]|nr:DUF2384 domain-containing protein [Gammaproteobacteria bacterium]
MKGQSVAGGVVGIEGIDVAPETLSDDSAYIRAARRGLPGEVVRQAVGVLGRRETLAELLGATPANLNRLYRRYALSRSQSEALLDMLRVVSRALYVFGDLDRANEWLDVALPALGGRRPIELCDTFQGRRLVSDAIRRIEYGEFP